MQLSLSIPVHFSKESYEYGSRSDGGTHGLVLTKPHVVSLILDLAGYTRDRDLGSQTLLEPACGHGAFLVPVAERLLASARSHGRQPSELVDAIIAFDIDEENVARTRSALSQVLAKHNVEARAAKKLVDRWVRLGDFLLTPFERMFDYVVGNPPYIRIEQLSTDVQSEYRRRYVTLFDRADIYVAFIERSLRLLSPSGVLSFVCADRWILNRYGAPLRKLVTSDYNVRAYVDLHQASPFESEVIAYPSIFVIGRGRTDAPVRAFTLTEATPDECVAVRNEHMGRPGGHPGVRSVIYPKWFAGSDPWILSSPEQLSTLRKLEKHFPLIEDDGRTFVRIGVATGNDDIYIVPSDADIEPSRLLPLVMRSAIERGKVKDEQCCVINTYTPDGIVDLADYPRLRRYFSEHAEKIKRRHVAQKSLNKGWFRTIDRVYPELLSKPKLLIPDIAGSNEVVFEPGHFYPHHNLYFIISDVWDMEVLGALLSSRVALFFVWSYAVKMRGGYLRFQAQYLRRIRVPRPETLASDLKRQLKAAFRKRDFAALDELAKVAYGLSRLPVFDFVDTRK